MDPRRVSIVALKSPELFVIFLPLPQRTLAHEHRPRYRVHVCSNLLACSILVLLLALLLRDNTRG
eukprot:COSAG02_NODE_8473_length_2560_cov_15.504325_2_plen_65_part_00